MYKRMIPNSLSYNILYVYKLKNYQFLYKLAAL